jgi:hypothetical protein
MSVVKDQRKVAIIVAGGPSAAVMKNFRVDKRKIAVIAVNGALDWLPWFDFFFTLDPTKVNRKRIRTYRHGAKYYIAYPKGKILLPSYVSRLDRYSPEASRTAVLDENGKYTCAIGLNINPNIINSGNSAFGALGLAYHLGFEKVGLIGVDANNAPRVDGGYSRDLSHLPDLFESAMHQIDIVNLGEMESKIPKMSLKEFAAGIPHISSKMVVDKGYTVAVQDQMFRMQAREEQLRRGEIVPTLADVTNTDPLCSALSQNDGTQLQAGGSVLLHEDLAVREESPGTHIHLPYLTTAL